MIFGLLRKINTAQPVRQGGLWDVYAIMTHPPLLLNIDTVSLSVSDAGH